MNDSVIYNIGYRGGSGGFLLLHLLLLSEQYYTNFQDNLECNRVIQQQWKINNHNRWKQNEVWVDNRSTLLASSCLDKILFFCNPDTDNDFFGYAFKQLGFVPKQKFVWLYTDVHSHNELAFYKKAYWYFSSTEKSKVTDLSTLSANWRDTAVDRDTVYFLDRSDIVIKLQDLVNNPEILIQHGLINNLNHRQLKLLHHWKSLHPPELLKSIGINIST